MFPPTSLVLGVLWISAIFVETASCKSPRVRREWREISKDERAEWISAVNCLANLPHNTVADIAPTVDPMLSGIPPITENSSVLDDFTYMHMDLNIRIHFTGQFLAWHRVFVHYFERALIDHCGYTGAQPYWDWTKDSGDLFASPLWDADSESGLGLTAGNFSDDLQLDTGGFSNLTLAYPVPHVLRRNVTDRPYLVIGRPWPDAGDDPAFDGFTVDFQATKWITPEYLEGMVGNKSFFGDLSAFQKVFENWNGPHGPVHLMLGGDGGGSCPGNAPEGCVPGPKWSTNDPIFWLHHAMVDRIWWDWQNRDSRNFYSYNGGSVQKQNSFEESQTYPTGVAPFLNLSSTIPGDGMWDEDLRVWDVIDIESGILCYTYEY